MTIPAKLFVDIAPGVLDAGGNALSFNGIDVTLNTRVPIGAIRSFPSPTAVGAFFGNSSDEKADADVYFAGFNGATKRPGAMLFAQWPQAAVAAWLRGGPLGLTLAQLQALSGSLTAVIDGYPHVISSISLSSYNSFSAAAAGIQSAFTNPTEAAFTASLGATFTATAGSPSTKLVVTSVTGLISIGDVAAGTGIPTGTTFVSQDSGGTPGGAGTYVLSAANTASAASCTATSTVLNVTAVSDDGLAVGQTLAGSGITGTPLITGFISGVDGAVGLYRISAGFQVASESMTAIATTPIVTYDSTSGAFLFTSGVTGAPSSAAFATGTLAEPLKLTSATGAELSQGSDALTPAEFMDGVTAVTTNWVSFFLNFDPDDGSGNATKLLFSEWTDAQDDTYVYAGEDPDITATQGVPATNSLGYLLQQADLSGTALTYEPTVQRYGAMLAGWIASIDFQRKNGRISFAFKSQSGQIATVTDETAAVNLGGNPQAIGDFGNGYNYYGAIATASQQFVNFQRGVVSGPWKWLDSYVNQIWLNSAFQQAIMSFMTQVNSFPYNGQGYALLEAALLDPINAGLNFGAFVAGVPLSAAQAAQVNQQVGVKIDSILTQQGWYLQIVPATPQVRAARASPTITFWYTDGESIQAVTLASIDVL